LPDENGKTLRRQQPQGRFRSQLDTREVTIAMRITLLLMPANVRDDPFSWTNKCASAVPPSGGKAANASWIPQESPMAPGKVSGACFLE